VFFSNSSDNLEIIVAKSANIINKPFVHSVLKISGENDISNNEDLDMTLNVLCRDSEGNRIVRDDLEIEIFNSKNELVLLISKLNYPNEPILWSGNKNLWMDSKSGKKCEPPSYNCRLENLATRIKKFIN
tara:strand:- start:57 stop:446 length:390 start_codon:yes stop_codon:yes gene_type:complete